MSAHLELRRARIAAAVERLIAVLDQLDSDADLEPDAADDDSLDEASLQPASISR